MSYLINIDLSQLKLRNTPRPFIGISGLRHHGKSQIANAYCSRGAFKFSFAEPLKDAMLAAFNWQILHKHEPLKDEIDPYWQISPREVFQWFGTEVARDMIHPDFWIKNLHDRLYQFHTSSFAAMVVIDDVRFSNEVNYIIQNGGWIIRVIRPNYSTPLSGIPNHRSEQIEGIYDSARKAGRYCEILNDKGVVDMQNAAYVLLDNVINPIK